MAALQDIVWLSLLLVLFIGSITGLAAGIGLVACSGPTLRFFAQLNRWVSTRSVLKPMEVPREVENRIPEQTRRRIAGLVFLLGGLYASILLVGTGTAGAVLFRVGRYAVIYSMLFDAFRLFLLFACAAAAIMGIMLLFFPRAWARLEAWGNRWYSTRRVIASGDVMHFPLDRWVEGSPRYAGGIITMFSIVSIVAFGILLYIRLYPGR